MRIHTGARARQVPPYNGIHEAFGPALWLRLFAARHDASQDEFVHLPETERELVMYAKSMSQSLCVVTGRRGVGKTSILRFVCSQWKESLACKVIYEDFRDETILTPSEYFTDPWAADTRRNFWMSVADEHLTRILKNSCKPLDENHIADLVQFFVFLQKYFRAAAPNTETTTSHEKLLNHLELIQSNVIFNRLRDPQFKFERLLFAFRLYQEKRKHVKLVIDNVDDKHRGFLNGLLEKLSHLQSSLHRIAVDANSHVVLTPFVALRPITFRVLQSFPQIDGHGWNALKEIEISQPAALSAIVKKRYAAICSSSDFGELSPSEIDMHRILQSKNVTIPVTDRQVRWQLPNRDHFIFQTLEMITHAKQDDELVDMSNHDLSDAIPAMGDVLKNRHFISEDDVVQVVRGANHTDIDKIAADAVSRVTVVRCLAYGNQGNNIPRYPVEDSRVANILHGRHSDCRLTLAKGRAIQALAKANQDEKVGISKEELTDVVAAWCDIDEERVGRLLDEMWKQGLLECDLSGDRPSAASNEDVILSCTPRATRLLNHIQNDSVLLLCYRDEIELADEVKWPGKKPAWTVNTPWQMRLSMEIRDKKSELEESAKIVQQIFCVEVDELHKSIGKIGEGSKRLFSEWFGGVLLSEMLLEGIRKSFLRYYQNFLSDKSDKQKWHIYLEEFRLHMENWRQGALN